jgi:hypothetical protein
VDVALETIAEQRELVVLRIGFREGELRLMLAGNPNDRAEFVIQLEQVASFFDSFPRGVAVRVMNHPSQGSFGWWLGPNETYNQLELRPKTAETAGLFLALTKRVVYRTCRGQDLNWPG